MAQAKTTHRPSPLKAARRYRAVSQRELARICGMSHVTISRAERGQTKRLHATSKQAIALALGFSVADLFPPPGKQTRSKELRVLMKAMREGQL